MARGDIMSDRLKLCYFAVGLILVLLFTGCSPVLENPAIDLSEEESAADDEAVGLRDTVLFYQDEAGFLIPVMRAIPWEEGIAKAALRYMKNTFEMQQDLTGMGLKALVPDGTIILGMSIDENGLATVDLSKEALEHNDALSESNMIRGVALALVEFPTIDRVQFLFEGNLLQMLEFGTQVGEPITPRYVNLEMGHDIEAQGNTVTVFFHTVSPSGFSYFIPVTRVVPAERVTLEDAMLELIRGLTTYGDMITGIPEGTRLLGVQMDKGTTYINFSREFAQLYESPEMEPSVLKSIIMSARLFPVVFDVRILVETEEYEGVESIVIPVFINEY